MRVLKAGEHVTPNLRLVRLLGAGAMGAVWAAENVSLGAEVAVKLMSARYDDEQAVLRFRQEALAAARIKSPYVAMVFDHGVTADGQPYIVMELLEGETLKKRLTRSGPLPLDEALLLFSQAARGVGAAHKLGVIHRDIKPDNLFVVDDDGDPFVKVLDFGIAKQLDVSAGLTSTGMAMGTPSYMSPEQFGDTKRVDRRADLWAMGVVAYELFTGQLPFQGFTIGMIALAVTKGEFKPPSALRPELPQAIDAWMAKALSVDVDARFVSMTEMAEALGTAAKPRPSQAPREPTVIRPGTLATEGEALPRGKPASPRADAEETKPSLIVTEDKKRSVWTIAERGAYGRAVAFDERGESLFVLSVASLTGKLFSVDVATQKLKWWAPIAARPICLCAGAGFVVVGCKDGKAHLFDSASGAVKTTIEVDATGVRAMAIDPSRKTLATCSKDQRIGLWTLATGDLIAAVEDPMSGIRGITFDAKSGLWATGARDAAVRLWDAFLKPVQALRMGGSPVRRVAFSADGSYLAAGRDDGALMIWSTATWKLEKTLEGHTSRVLSLTFVPRLGSAGDLVSGSEDGTIRVWSLGTNKARFTVSAGKSVVDCVAASPDGRSFAAAAGTVHVSRWPLHSTFVELAST